MSAVADLFPDAPRRAPIKRMHVADAGSEAISFECHRCGHKTGWLLWNQRELTVTQARRGVACPTCNRDAEVTP
jgi:DNA-directed RNA polymerase subunit RPC12/RpoP